MATQNPISSAIDDSMENLRRMIAAKNVDREPAGSMQDQVERNVGKMQFAPTTPADQMQESIDVIKRQERNKEENLSMPPGMILKQGPMLAEEMTPAQRLMSMPQREPAVESVGPVLEKARKEIMVPSTPKVGELKNLAKQAEELQKKALEEPKSLKEYEVKAEEIKSSIQKLMQQPGQDVTAKETIQKALDQSALAQLRQQERLATLTEKSGKPLFEKGDTAKVALLALAPIVAGYLVDGARGGAIGAAAGQLGVAKFEEQKKDQLERELKALERSFRVDSSTLYSQSRLVDAINRMDQNDVRRETQKITSARALQKQLFDLGMQNLKSLEEQRKAGLISGQKYFDARAKIQKDIADITAKGDDLNLRLASLEEKRQGRVEKKAAEKGLSDLGFGFKVKEGASKEDRKKAQTFVSAYGNVEPAMQDLIEGVKGSSLKSISSWSQAGEDLQRKATNLKDALIAYSKRGASLTKNEERLVNDLGFNLSGEGSIRNAFKLTYSPEQLANQLNTVLSQLKRRTAGQVKPYGVELVGEQAAPQAKPTQAKAPQPQAASSLQQLQSKYPNDILRAGKDGKVYRFDRNTKQNLGVAQ